MGCRVGSYIRSILCALLGRSYLFARIDCCHVHVVIACVNDFEAEILTKRDDGLLYGKGRDGVSESGTFCALPRWGLVSGGRWLVGTFFLFFYLLVLLFNVVLFGMGRRTREVPQRKWWGVCRDRL
jgi:hypothetical protein